MLSMVVSSPPLPERARRRRPLRPCSRRPGEKMVICVCVCEREEERERVKRRERDEFVCVCVCQCVCVRERESVSVRKGERCVCGGGGYSHAAAPRTLRIAAAQADHTTLGKALFRPKSSATETNRGVPRSYYKMERDRNVTLRK